nr:MAG TPA: hypothetical protein [Caudoviricetes sp.]
MLFLRPNTSKALNCCVASDTDDNGCNKNYRVTPLKWRYGL